MSTPTFNQPGKGDKFTPRDHPEWLGKLFLIYPDSCSPQTFNRPDGTQETSDIVEADVAIIDLIDPQTGQPTTLSGARIGGKGLVPQLRKMVGSMVLGRLTKLPSQGQKDGAYILADYTPEDAQTATAYVQAHPRTAPFGQPQGQAQAPAQAQAQGQGYPPQAQAQPTQPQGAQYASQALPYDPWAGSGAQAPPQAPGQPQAPAQAQGQGWQAAPVPPQTQAPAVPNAWPDSGSSPLAQFLESKGVPTQGMQEDQMRMIASTFPDNPFR
ncbi:hypothetical protein IGW14_06855 [Streptomyces hygroscopicus subsp. hygroscopicus]|uniref:hypothetical protein n=1 Tax=Streptomyces hygroscopicus TaxID=1912 RepID=UPI001C657AEA|nr:hypothetical protein [Streptomyces hygroscopicus]MBW8087772.1 hypothetical protein [Streptomyces hygroscopicus subsp. hygroscopicus]